MNRLCYRAADRIRTQARWAHRRTCVAVVVGWILVYSSVASVTAAGREPDGDARVAAIVDDVNLYVGEVEWIVGRVAGWAELAGPARDLLRAEALDQLVRQQIVLSELEREREACTQQELDLAIARFSEELKRQGKTLDDLCRARHIPQVAIERGLRWRMSWNAYLAKRLTEEHLQRYFELHRRDFDGSRLRVAHILLPLPADGADDQRVRQQAEDLRRKIDQGSLTFADAARQYSQAPSAAAGGDMGWISRHEPMPDSFSFAAYQLEPGEVSPPVRSPAGIHLIKCLEIELGTRTWQDARDDLTAAVQRDLFEQMVDSGRKRSRVQFSDGQPHFRPGTKELEQTSSDVETREATGK